MRRLIFFSIVLTLLIIPAQTILAQQPPSIGSLEDEIRTLEALERSEVSTAEVRQLNRQFLAARKSRLRSLLEIRIDALRKYQSDAGNILKSDENEAITKSIKSLEQKLAALEGEISTGGQSRNSPDAPSAGVADVMVISSLPVVGAAFNGDSDAVESPAPARSQNTGAQGATQVVLGLSAPGKGRTALPTGKFELSWGLRSGGAVFHPPKGTKYVVEVSEKKNSFDAATDTINENVTDDTSFEIPKDALRPGKKYFWQVTALCPPSLTCPKGMLTAVNGPFEFTTALDPFRRLENKGFTLQRSVAGDDATEGATFSFLRNFHGKNVYATDFALIWDKPNPVNLGANSQIFPELSVEGHLSSDRTASEDLWRFGASAAIFTSFTGVTKDEEGKPKVSRLRGLSSYLGGKFEADRDFETKKVYFEALETPTVVSAYIGKYSGNTDSAIQFRWRPYFSFQAGRTLKRGAAALPEDTVLRLVQRLRTDLKLNFISRPMGFKRTLLYTDDTFFYLPLENAAKTPNFLVSGFEVQFNSNIGLAFTYKNGKNAPKFERVHSLGAGLTISFGNKSDN